MRITELWSDRSRLLCCDWPDCRGEVINRKADIVDGTIAKGHVNAIGMGAAPNISVRVTRCVLHRSIPVGDVRRAINVVVKTDRCKFVVGEILPVGVIIGIEVFIADEIRVAGSLDAEMSHGDLAPLERNAG